MEKILVIFLVCFFAHFSVNGEEKKPTEPDKKGELTEEEKEVNLCMLITQLFYSV